MGKDSIVESQRFSGLRVRGFSSESTICILYKGLYSFERSHIPTGETAKKWRHLEVIAD